MTFSFKFRRDWLTFLVVVNAVLFIIPGLFSVYIKSPVGQIDSSFLYLLGSLQESLVLEAGEYWRMVMASFLHVDIIHVLANMIGLIQLGAIVRNYYGGKLLLVFYIFTGLGGSILSLLFLNGQATVGASAAVFGLMGVLISGAMKKTAYGLQLPFNVWDILPLAVFAFLIGLDPSLNVNNWGHLGGFLAGLILGRLFHHQIVTWKPKWEELLADILYYSSVVLMIGSLVMMLIALPDNISILSYVYG